MPTKNICRSIFHSVSALSTVTYLTLLSVFLASGAVAQVQRDGTAVNSLATAINRMGSLPPQDSTALASTTSFKGSTTSLASVKILTRGMDQTSEQFSTANSTASFVFSQGSSNDKSPDAKPGQDPWSYELSLTAQSPFFPLPWLAARYSNADVSVENLGTDSQAGVPAVHLRLTNTFASQPILKHYASLTRCDVWFDPTSGLPIRDHVRATERGRCWRGDSDHLRVCRLQERSRLSIPVSCEEVREWNSLG